MDAQSFTRKGEPVKEEMVKQFKVELVMRRRDILVNLQRLREGLAIEPGITELEERVQGVVQKSTTASLGNALSRELLQVTDAMTRIVMGTFGICPDCRQEIPMARMKAHNYAERCRDCQEAVERVAVS